MNDFEKVALALAALGIVAVLIYRDPAQSPETIDQPMSVRRTGPAYLTYNYPWGNNAAIGNVLPTTSVGQVGQSVNQLGEATDFSNCGCGA